MEPLIIRNQAGGPSRYTLQLSDEPSQRYERLYAVRRYTSPSMVNNQHTLQATYTVTDKYPTPEIISRIPETAPDLPAYVLDRVRMEDARDDLRDELPKGTTVYTIRRNPMGRGPAHLIDLVSIDHGEPHHLTQLVADAIGGTIKRDCLYMDGGGMDLGFEAVYVLAHALYADGYALNHRWL